METRETPPKGQQVLTATCCNEAPMQRTEWQYPKEKAEVVNLVRPVLQGVLSSLNSVLCPASWR